MTEASEQIIKDLVELRFRKELAEVIESRLESRYSGQALKSVLGEEVDKIIKEYVKEKRGDIKNLVMQSFERLLKNSTPLITFETGVSFNLPAYEIEKLGEQRREIEKTTFDKEKK